MSKLCFVKTAKNAQLGVKFRCPGCGETHMLYTQDTPAEFRGPRWEFNGDSAKPTFHPSIKATGFRPSANPDEFDDPTKDQRYVCHSWVKDGRIQFLGDCTHDFKNQTLEIPQWPA